MAPHGLVGIALAAWGWAVGIPALGIALGGLFEGLRFSNARIGLGEVALARLLRVTFVAAIGAFVFSIATQRAPQSLYGWLRWLPVFLLPIPFLQALRGELPVSALRQSMRFGGKPLPPDPRPWDATHAFALCCLVAVGTASSAEPWFFALAFALVAWALVARMRRQRVIGIALLACAGTLGLGVATGLFKLQSQIEEWGEEIFDEMFAADADPFRERTRIGDMGKIKLNDRIVMRAVPEGPRPMQILLREASFDRYRNGTWESSRTTLRAVAREGGRWRLRADEGSARIVLRRSFPRGEGLLPLPPGASSIEHLEAAGVDASDVGTTRVRGAANPVAMRVFYDEGLDARAPVDDADREVPEALQPMLQEIVASRGIRAPSNAASLDALYRYFATFSYSLQLSSPRDKKAGRTISDFLLRDHKGHCEYFASATVLVLRQAGIPARYAVGYSAQEFSGLEKAFVVRSRHAHAWALALIDGRWTPIDTTPANWADQEAEAAHSPLGAVMDVLSWAWESLQIWWARSDATDFAAIGLIVALLIGAPFIVRKLPRFRRSRSARASVDAVTIAWRDLEARIAKRGFAREPPETVRDWTRRLAADAGASAWHAPLAELATLYYRVRFDPAAPASARDAFLARARDFGV